jgi:peptide/nickel transport system ATP-binding protein
VPAVIEVKNLKKYFEMSGGVLQAVDDVSFKVERGETIGIVGESGCGKTTLGRTIIHLEEITDGRIFFHGEDVTRLGRGALKRFREKVQMIFQDPNASLNPRMTIEETISEPLRLSGRYPRAQLGREVKRLMERTGIEERLGQMYPHELSDGWCQRVGIARALALDPDFIVCDEPVSALDVSVQAQILNLLMEMQETAGLTMMFVTHDLSVARHVSDTIIVMYLGQIVEMGPTEEVFHRQLHPYTKALLSAVPSIDIHRPSRRIVLKGEPTSPINLPPACRFRSRCHYANDLCRKSQRLDEVSPGYFVACIRALGLNAKQI